MLNSLLHLDLNNCLLQRGQYTNIKYYTFPVNVVNFNIHNILYRNTMPIFRNDSNFNNYISLVYRYLFHSRFTNFSINENFSKTIRSSEEDFIDYIFDCTTTFNSYKISFDSVNDILTAISNKDKNVE
jgi:hypothetical protein